MTCGLCGRAITGQYLTTELDEAFCAAHADRPFCRLCAAPVADGGLHCRRCGATVVLDQAAVRRTLPRVREGLHAMGIRLATPVRVTLVSEQEMTARAGHLLGGATGLTVHQGQKVLSLSIVAGLPAVEFGSVVAHEGMHAWMAQRGFPPNLPEPVSEGLCQLASYGWLRRQPDRRAKLLLRAIERDPDPVYGDGFRRVRDAVLRHGLRAVLVTVHATSDLPRDGSAAWPSRSTA